MKRTVDLREISDGRFYGLNDMVRADCGDCKGCSACCHGMGTSIVLDPMDIYRLTNRLGLSFQQLLSEYIELNVVDGVILPNLKMVSEMEHCAFLTKEDRCSIHESRPGICRIFPLGRLYEHNTFQYFLQVHECKNLNRTKVKVKKWIDTPDANRYDQYIADWHNFLLALQKEVKAEADLSKTKQICMRILEQFYFTPYEKDRDFYDQFYERQQQYKKATS